MGIVTNESMMIEFIISSWYKRLSFPLFDLIKVDLPKDYLITTQDINFLLEIGSCIDWDYACEIGFGEYVKEFFEKNPEFLKKHIDPYELFIDSWYLDSKLNVIKKTWKNK